MTKYSDKSTEEMASAFIVGTCKLLPKSLSAVSDHMHNLIGSHATKNYSILCGSAAEFYIRPVNSCIDDSDYLVISADELAYCGDFPLDISGLSETIKCFHIESCDRYPGFVRLRMLVELNFNWQNKMFDFNRTLDADSYLVPDMDILAKSYFPCTQEKRGKNMVSGPAIKHGKDARYEYNIESDMVKSVWCPQWPKEAQGWFKRPRNNGWPTNDTIAELLENGCHVVYVQHRSCRDDKLQWRLSFSVAEVILLQSWTQIQQIVYHLLRVFVKSELIQKDCSKEDEVFCPYHLKTLMLWTCEEMSPEWWDSFTVIAICCELLQKLSDWLKRRYCPNYFIPEANLFHEPSNSSILEKIEKRLDEFKNSSSLCNWFVENYILPFIRRRFEITNSMEVMPHLTDYMLPLFEFWNASELKSLDFIIFQTFTYSHSNTRFVIKSRLSSGLRQFFKDGNILRCLVSSVHRRVRDLPTMHNVLCITYYDNLLFILHTAYGLGCGEISWDSSLFVEAVNAISSQPKIIRSTYHNFPKSYTEQSSRFQFLRALDLLQNLTGSNCRPEFQLLSLMSKEFLRRALEYEDSKSNGVAPLALAYLAALHFATSEYQEAMRLCLAVLVDRTPHENKDTLNAGCLLFIDDIARIVGSCILQKKITDNNLRYVNKRFSLDLRLSPVMFAHYLFALSDQRSYKYLQLHNDLPDSKLGLPMDVYLTALINPKFVVSIKSGTHFEATRQIVESSSHSLLEMESTNVNTLIVKESVIHALMENALEIMTSFYTTIHKDFGIQCSTADCYRAVYLYKCRQYDEVLQLCERILYEPDLQCDLKEFSFANVLLFPPFNFYFDRDIQSLLGFHTMFYYLSPLNDDPRKDQITADSTFAHWFVYIMTYRREVLSSFLQCHYSLKCHYFLGRHFLARYLRVRCCFDCNLPYSEALTEFATQETNLPFEHIIRGFLLRKFRIIKK